MKTAYQLEDKIEVMEQGEGQSSGNEETPYTVVVQIPNPYGDSSMATASDNGNSLFNVNVLIRKN